MLRQFYLLSEREAKRGEYDYSRQWNKKAHLRLCKHYHFALRKGKFNAANKIRKKIMSEIKQIKSAKWRILYITCLQARMLYIKCDGLLFLFRKEKSYA